MRLALSGLVLGALAIAFAGAASADGFVVMRIEVGEKLEYKIVPEADFDRVKAEVEEAAKPDKAKVKKVGGVLATQEEADQAMREDADKDGLFTCWRCDGTGEVAPLPEVVKPGSGGMGMGSGVRPGSGGGPQQPKALRCPICGGRKHVKCDGYSILKVKFGQSWGYVFARRSMLGYLEEQLKIANQLQAMGGQGGSTERPTLSAVEQFRPGQFDQAKARHDQLETEADGKPGFLHGISVPGITLPQVQWPTEFFTK